jgi:hypothetical protein
MTDQIEGFLEVGRNEQEEIVVNIPPNRKKREQHKTNCAYRGNTEELCNCGIEYEHIVFSANQARRLAWLLIKHAEESEREAANKREQERLKNIPPVDRTKRCMTSGNPETPDHRELLPNGQQKDYVVLCPAERAKGFIRPVRRTYRHKTCNSTTTMGTDLAETYARDPGFYSGTFCCACAAHFPLDQFIWEGTRETLGT